MNCPRQEDVFPLIGHCFHLARRRMDTFFQSHGITPVQARCMLFLIHTPEPVSQRDLERFLKVRASTVNGIVDRMVEKGLLQRVVSQQDARYRHIALTKTGRDKQTIFEDGLRQNETASLQNFRPEEVTQLRELLSRIIHNLEEDIDPC